MDRIRHARNRRGVGFVAICAALAGLIAFAGLGIDLGRMLVEHRALRTRAKAAALRAALALDGTGAGLDAARERAKAGSEKLVEKIEFAEAPVGPWSAEPADPASMSIARVTLRESVSLTLIRTVVPDGAKWIRAAASARSMGQRVELIR